MAAVVVIVSTEPSRVLAVACGGFVASIGLGALWQWLLGLPALISAVLALAVAALTMSFLIAVIVEGMIDRRHRRAIGEHVSHADVTTTDSRRCGHCRRPLVTVGGVSICAHCDQ